MSSVRLGVARVGAVLASALLLTLPAASSFVGASSHREAPLISQDPAVDHTDVYAFVSPDDPSKVTLIANWIPFEEPGGGPNFYHFAGRVTDDPPDMSSAPARYLIKVDRDGDAVEDLTYEWVFTQRIMNKGTFLYATGPISDINDSTYNVRQYYTVTEISGSGPGATRTVLGSNLLMPPDNIGPRSTPNYEALAAQGIHDLGHGIMEFTGQREDPFFVDVGSIFDLGALRPLNEAHAVARPRAGGVDTTGGYNVHATAIQVPRSRLAPHCSGDAADMACVIGVWSTAERRTTTVLSAGKETASGDWVQVSRLGNPLVNEAVMDLSLKDTFNAVPPSVDRTVPAVVAKVTDPELGRLIPKLYPGVEVPPAPRNDLVTVFLTGIPGVNQQQNSGATPSEQLRLNTAIPPTAGACQGNRLGVIGGDNAGFPNGRRLEDDVTDVALRAVAGGYAFTSAFDHAPNNALGDGLDRDDAACLASFPYVGTPFSGFGSVPHSGQAE